MNSEAHQPDATATYSAATDSDDESGRNDDGVVVAFPTRADTKPPDGGIGEEPWRYRVERRSGGMEFTAHVTYVDGAEGERLRRELAAVTRELLVWAAERKRDRDRDTSTRQDRAA